MTMPMNLTPSEAERWAYANGDAIHGALAQITALAEVNGRLSEEIETLQAEIDDLLLGEDA